MSSDRERLVEWLRDAHAAEEHAATMLRKTASQIDTSDAFRAGLERHGELSAKQADELKALLESLDEGTSVIKTITGQIVAIGQTLSGYLVSDEPVKAALATATYARMEVGSYRVLIAAAQAAGETGVAAFCEALLADELEFAEWVDEQLPVVAQNYLAARAAE